MMASANPFTGCQSDWEVHIKLMTTICCDYLGAESWKEKFEKFKLKSFLYLKTPTERSVSTPYDIWKQLEHKDLLRPKEYDVLKRLVSDIDYDLVGLIEDAEERLSFLQGEEVPERKRRKIEQETDFFQSIKQKWLKKSEKITKAVPVAPFQDDGNISVELLYAKVCIKTDPRYEQKGPKEQRGRGKIVKCPDDIFIRDKEPTKRIFMTGDPAHGKTTYCVWMLKHWINAQKTTENEQNDWEKALGKFDFVFLIILREVDKSRGNVTEMICKDILEMDDASTERFKQAMKDGKHRIFIILDGLDEWYPDNNVTSNKRFRGMPIVDEVDNCIIFITMRPWKFLAVGKSVNSDDRVVEIEGLDENGIKDVTENVLINYFGIDTENEGDKQKYDSIIEKVNHETVNSIMKIPLLAVLCVQILYHEDKVGSSMTQFYIKMIEMLIERTDGPHDIKNVAQEIGVSDVFMFQSYKSLLCKLGKIAYYGLMSGKYSFEYPAETITKLLDLTELELDFLLNVGILCKEETISIMTKTVKLYFFHTSLQEFLGALYIVEKEYIQSAFLDHLSSITVLLKFRNVLLFLSGLSTELGCRISQHVFMTANADSEINELRTLAIIGEEHHKDSIDLLYALQASCYNEIITNQNGHDFQYQVADIYLSIEHDKKTVQTTCDILKHHNADIKFLYLSVIEEDITESLLTNYLDHTTTLKSLHLNLDVTLCKISTVFSSLIALELFNLSLSPEFISSLRAALESKKVIQTFGLANLRRDIDEKPALLTDLMVILPDLPCLSALKIDVRHEDDKLVLAKSLSRLFNIQHIDYDGVQPRDNDYDRRVVDTICKWPRLRSLNLINVNLGDKGLNLPHNMLHLETVKLNEVEMSQLGWDNFIQSAMNINHELRVCLILANLDEQSLRQIRSSRHFEIAVDDFDQRSKRHNVEFINLVDAFYEDW